MSVGIDLERFDNFKYSEFRSLEVLSATQIKLTFAVQDKARDFDWISLALEFSGVSDARLLDEKKLSHIDMSDGVSIIQTDNKFAFGIGECYNISTIQSATLFIVYQTLKVQEGQF